MSVASWVIFKNTAATLPFCSMTCAWSVTITAIPVLTIAAYTIRHFSSPSKNWFSRKCPKCHQWLPDKFFYGNITNTWEGFGEHTTANDGTVTAKPAVYQVPAADPSVIGDYCRRCSGAFKEERDAFMDRIEKGAYNRPKKYNENEDYLFGGVFNNQLERRRMVETEYGPTFLVAFVLLLLVGASLATFLVGYCRRKNLEFTPLEEIKVDPNMM